MLRVRIETHSGEGDRDKSLFWKARNFLKLQESGTGNAVSSHVDQGQVACRTMKNKCLCDFFFFFGLVWFETGFPGFVKIFCYAGDDFLYNFVKSFCYSGLPVV